MRASWLSHTLLPVGLVAAVAVGAWLDPAYRPVRAEDQTTELLESGSAALAADAPLDQVVVPGTPTPTAPAAQATGASGSAVLLEQAVLNEIVRGAPTARAVDSATMLDAIRRARQTSVYTMPTPEPPPPTPPRQTPIALPPTLTASAPSAAPAAPAQSPTSTATPAAATPAAR